jgi:hypothetical protein
MSGFNRVLSSYFEQVKEVISEERQEEVASPALQGSYILRI